MKVIAKTDGAFLGEFNKSEVEKYLNLYYDKMPPIKVGDVIDLGKSYDFARDVRDAFVATEKMIKDNSAVMKAITNGVSICSLDNEKRGDWNVAALAELSEIDEGECGPEAWTYIQNAMEHLK